MNKEVGLIGCGRWGLNILRDLIRLGCAVHVYDPDPAACELAQERGAASSTPEFSGLQAGLDGYLVASPTIHHFESVSRLLPLGRPIFCEKPLTPDSTSARQLAKDDRGQVFVMDKWRYHPGIEALAEICRNGELGAVRQVRTRRVQWGQPHRDVDGVWILAPHDVSIVQHILGYLPEAVAAVADYSGERMDGLVAILGSGPVAVLEVSSRQPIADRLVSVSFEHGVAWLSDPLADHICLHGSNPGSRVNPGSWGTRPIDTEWPLFLELEHFIAFLGGGPPPYTNASQAADQVALIERMRQLASSAQDADDPGRI